MFRSTTPSCINLLLAFSGGGTRAAALSYGVLQELRDTRVNIDGREERLLDEVDLIASVSGGNFTSEYLRPLRSRPTDRDRTASPARIARLSAPSGGAGRCRDRAATRAIRNASA